MSGAGNAVVVMGLLMALLWQRGNGVDGTAVPQLPPAAELEAAIQPIVDSMARKYHCGVTVGMRWGGGHLEWAAGSIDNGTTASGGTTRTDTMVWGSVTKVVTGTAVLKLVANGVLNLTDPVAPLIDPILGHSTSTGSEPGLTMEALFGRNVSKVTVDHLMSMRSGIPDYDTADGGTSDPFRKRVYAHPGSNFGPVDLLALFAPGTPLHTGALLYPPGSYQSYSSTNFILLGLLLAQHANGATSAVEAYNQGSIFAGLEPDFKLPGFAVRGPPADQTRVRGYDRTPYNGQVPTVTGEVDVSGVDGVFAGFTASDVVGDVRTIAGLTYEVYGPPTGLLPPSMKALMVPQDGYYGRATHNLTQKTGEAAARSGYGTAYGHKGATYGYQSLVAFMPGLGFALAVATNLELDLQQQPSDIFCGVYNRLRNVILNEPTESCTFVGNSYDSSNCNCTVSASVSTR